MIVKMFEVRDSGTFIPVMATKLTPGGSEMNRYLLARAGYGRTPAEQSQYVMLTRVSGGGGVSHSDPWGWSQNPRTMHVAHKYITEHFDDLQEGAVVDVEFILGITTSPKVSERESYSL